MSLAVLTPAQEKFLRGAAKPSGRTAVPTYLPVQHLVELGYIRLAANPMLSNPRFRTTPVGNAWIQETDARRAEVKRRREEKAQ